MISPRHAEALRYAADGIPVFPCQVNGKAPACPHGHKDATTNLEQINDWWTRADYNIGLCPEDAGWAVVDLDCGGLETWDRLVREFILPRTSSVNTPSGGRHYYFTGRLPASVSKIGTGIDTRGIGSYVLVPPSVINGKEYQWTDDSPTAPLPGWISDRLKQSAQRVTESTVDELDLPANIARAEKRLLDLVARGDVAIEGKGGDDRTYRLVAEIRELGLSPETTLDLVYNIWNPHCLPPWDRDELGAKIENASRYAQNAAGAFAVGSTQEAFGPAIDKLRAEAPKCSPTRPSRILSGQEIKNIAEPEWLIPDILPARTLGVWYGDEGTYKTSIAFQMCFCAAHQIPFFGHTFERPLQTLYLSAEGREFIAHHTLPALEVMFDKKCSADTFHYLGDLGPIWESEEYNEIIEDIERGKFRPDIVVLDTQADATDGLQEKDLFDMRKYIKVLKKIRDEIGATSISLNHINNEGKLRGAGNKAFDFRVRFTGWDAVKAVAMNVEKMRGYEKRKEPWTFAGQKIGRGLVFRETTFKEHGELTRTENLYSRARIGAALEQLGAIGLENAVPRRHLAAVLVTTPGDEKEIDAADLALKILSRSALVSYCSGPVTAQAWFLERQAPT